MCQTCWQCPGCGARMLAREQWEHQCGKMADFLRSKGFLPGGEVDIDGESWTAEDLAAIETGPVEWGETT